MGAVGLAFGIGLGLLINIILGQVGVDYSAFAGMTEYTALINTNIYSSLGLEKIFQRGLTVLAIALVCSYYPAREASMTEPAQALHFV